MISSELENETVIKANAFKNLIKICFTGGKMNAF